MIHQFSTQKQRIVPLVPTIPYGLPFQIYDPMQNIAKLQGFYSSKSWIGYVFFKWIGWLASHISHRPSPRLQTRAEEHFDVRKPCS